MSVSAPTIPPSELPLALARGLRYADILSAETLRLASATIIGVGAVGSAIARFLAQMGVGQLQLIDPDKVGPENLGTQGFRVKDIGVPKVEAVASLLHDLNPEINLTLIPARYMRDIKVEPYVFMCVDTMAARSFIYKSLSPVPTFYCDCRMALELGRLLVVRSAADNELYLKTLHSDEESSPLPCTASSTPYTGTLLAALAVYAFRLALSPTRSYCTEQVVCLSDPGLNEHAFAPIGAPNARPSPSNPTSLAGEPPAATRATPRERPLPPVPS